MTGLILIDGPDCAGKTTLAGELGRQARVEPLILHQPYRWKDKIFTYHTAVLRQAIKGLARGRLVIIDRLWPTETIYGRVYRGGSSIPHYGRMVERVLLKHAALTIICSGKPAEIEARHQRLRKERHEDYTDKMGVVAARFNHLFRGQQGSEPRSEPKDYADDVASLGGLAKRLDCAYYDFTGEDVKKFARVALDRLWLNQHTQVKLALDPNFQNILGHVGMAEVVLVGERCNPKHRGIYWPFYEYGNSSLYLAEALHQLNTPEHKLLWINAGHPGFKDCLSCLRSTTRLRWVALGKEAACRLKAAGVPHSQVPHPQHARRFHHGDSSYAATLGLALGDLSTSDWLPTREHPQPAPA